MGTMKVVVVIGLVVALTLTLGIGLAAAKGGLDGEPGGPSGYSPGGGSMFVDADGNGICDYLEQ